MKKKLLCIFCASLMTFSSINLSTAFGATGIRTVQGYEINSLDGIYSSKDSFRCVNINGTLYYNIKDLAYSFKDSTMPFDVRWNSKFGQIEILTNTPFSDKNYKRADYQEWSGFNSENTNVKVNATPKKVNVSIDGTIYPFNVYNINGNTYFNIYDLQKFLGLNIKIDRFGGTFIITYGNSNSKMATDLTNEPIKVSDENKSFYEITSQQSNIYIFNNNNNTFSILEGTYEKIKIATYNLKDSKRISYKEIPLELPQFKSFFSGNKYNFIAFSDDNENKDDNREVLRIVKYDKNFNRLGSISLNGKQTFAQKIGHFGALRMAENGNELILHMSRLRYDDHQSNFTVFLNTDTMNVTTYDYLKIPEIANKITGTFVNPTIEVAESNLIRHQENHVSHSFAQFVKYDGNKPIFVDLGDAYPRGVTLNIPKDDVRSEYEEYILMNIPGKSGNNATGVTIGGFEISDTNYIVAINSIDHTKYNESDYTNFGVKGEHRNIIILTLDKNTNATKQINITNYAPNTVMVSEPRLVKINNNKFMLLWNERDYSEKEKDDTYKKTRRLKYVYLDGQGNKIGNIMENKNFLLSYDQPVVIDNNVVWTYYKIGSNSKKTLVKIPIQ